MRVLMFLSLIAAAAVFFTLTGAVRADSFDYDYSCTRFLDPTTGDPVTVYANYYETDASGDPLYTEDLPVYVGWNPDTSNPIWLEPGFSVAITDIPGIGPVAGAPQPIPAGRPGALPPGTTPSGQSGGYRVNKHSGSLTIQTAAAGATATPVKGNTPTGPPVPIGPGTTLGPGCWVFSTWVTWTGCNVQLEPLANGDFSDVYAILGGGSYWPNSDVPSFYANENWDLVYIGDSSSPFGDSGFGEADVQCNDDEFMSVATPEGYVGCVPEPITMFGVLAGVIGLGCYVRKHKTALLGR